MVHRAIHLIGTLLDRTDQIDQNLTDYLNRRGLSYGRSSVVPTQSLALLIITLIVGFPVLILVYLSEKLNMEILFIIATVLTFMLITIPLVIVLVLTIKNIRQYFVRRKMVRDFAAKHPERVP